MDGLIDGYGFALDRGTHRVDTLSHDIDDDLTRQWSLKGELQRGAADFVPCKARFVALQNFAIGGDKADVMGGDAVDAEGAFFALDHEGGEVVVDDLLYLWGEGGLDEGV